MRKTLPKIVIAGLIIGAVYMIYKVDSLTPKRSAEIPNYKYDDVVRWSKKHPEVNELTRAMMNDGKITESEFSKIQDLSMDLWKKQDRLLLEQTKHELKATIYSHN